MLVCMYRSICVYMYVCMYVYIYIYIYYERKGLRMGIVGSRGV